MGWVASRRETWRGHMADIHDGRAPCDAARKRALSGPAATKDARHLTLDSHERIYAAWREAFSVRRSAVPPAGSWHVSCGAQ